MRSASDPPLLERNGLELSPHSLVSYLCEWQVRPGQRFLSGRGVVAAGRRESWKSLCTRRTLNDCPLLACEGIRPPSKLRGLVLAASRSAQTWPNQEVSYSQ